jgi:coproporphyrinogen III oxidase-like Fe-S oxidoreductase
MKKENLNKNISYSCWARSELMDDEVAEILKEMNFINIGLGVESVSPKILKTLKGKTANINIHQKAIDTLHKSGIDVALAFIIGYPDEKKEDLENIYSFIIKNEDKISEIEINPLRPMPGTIYWKMAHKKGLVGFDMDWKKLADHSLQLTFNKDNFIYLNENMAFDEFIEMKDKLLSLYPRINMSQKNIENSTRLINAHNFPARLKSIF